MIFNFMKAHIILDENYLNESDPH